MSKSLSATLRRLRKASGLSQQALADLSKLTKQTIINIEGDISKTPHPRTLKALDDVLRAASESLTELASLDQPFDNAVVSRPESTVPLYKEWNDPIIRSQMIARLSDDLIYDSPDVTSYIDYFTMLSDFEFLDNREHIQSTTLEYPQLWANADVFVPYEAALIQHNSEGRAVDRVFIVHPARLDNRSYLQTVRRVLHRHTLIGLTPRVLLDHEAQTLSRSMGTHADGILIFDNEYSVLLDYHTGREPALLGSHNEKFCVNASNAFLYHWHRSRPALEFLARLDPISRREAKAIEQEAELVFKVRSFL